jgi:predicted  nucleic acid-binding Zn-ribbon protein
MNTESWKIAALTLFLAFLLAGAPLSMAADSSTGKTTGQDVSQKIDETAHAIGNFSTEQRDEALNNAKSVLEDMDARIDHLENEMGRNWDKMNAAARKRAQETMKTLRRQRQDLSQSYGELKRSSSNAWEEVKGGFAKSYDALRDSFSKAAKEF